MKEPVEVKLQEVYPYTYYDGTTVEYDAVALATYMDGSLAVILFDSESGLSSYDSVVLSVNLEMALPEHTFCMDVNGEVAKEMAERLAVDGYLSDTGFKTPSGFVTYPVYEVTHKLQELIKAKEEA